jgi:hypothetical protein
MKKKKTLKRKNNKKQRKTLKTIKKRKTQKGGNNTIHYIISSHGEILPRENLYMIPDHVKINFYGHQGEILYCTNHSPKDICKGILPSVELYDEINKYAYKEALPVVQTLFGPAETSFDYIIYPDLNERFGEIYVCDGKKLTLAKIPWQLEFSDLLKEITHYSHKYYPRKSEIVVHCLFCRV